MGQVTAVVLVAAWAVEAAVVGYVMRRRGYDGYAWTVMALVLGPLVLPLAVRSLRNDDSDASLLRPGTRGAGAVDVLVGIDGSPESLAAARAAATLFGQETGRVTLANVIAVDAAPEAETTARQTLMEAAGAGGDPALVLLRGRPAPSLTAYARRLGYEVIAVGTRGAGRSALAGSVANELARGSGGVPVLLTDAGGPGGHAATRGSS